MKETIERSLWAILICILCVLLAVLFTSSMLFDSRFSGDIIAQLSPAAGILSGFQTNLTA